MTNYNLLVIYSVIDCVCCVVQYLGDDKCFSTYYNYYHKYTLKTRDIHFKEYCPLSIHKKTNDVFKSPMILSFAEDVINDSFNKIDAELTIGQINYLKTLNFIEDIRLKAKVEIKTISNEIGENTKNSFVNNNPNTNFD